MIFLKEEQWAGQQEEVARLCMSAEVQVSAVRKIIFLICACTVHNHFNSPSGLINIFSFFIFSIVKETRKEESVLKDYFSMSGHKRQPRAVEIFLSVKTVMYILWDK